MEKLIYSSNIPSNMMNINSKKVKHIKDESDCYNLFFDKDSSIDEKFFLRKLNNVKKLVELYREDDLHNSIRYWLKINEKIYKVKLKASENLLKNVKFSLPTKVEYDFVIVGDGENIMIIPKRVLVWKKHKNLRFNSMTSNHRTKYFLNNYRLLVDPEGTDKEVQEVIEQMSSRAVEVPINFDGIKIELDVISKKIMTELYKGTIKDESFKIEEHFTIKGKPYVYTFTVKEENNDAESQNQ